MKSQTSGRTTVILLVALNLFVLLYFVIIPRAAASTGCFPDTNGHWAEEFICWMSDQGLVGGYPDGTFKPNNQVTRAELSVITSKTYDLVEANDDDTLGALSCTTDQIAKWNGSAWECQADETGSGGGSDTLADLSCATDDIARWNGSTWVCDNSLVILYDSIIALETLLDSVNLENGGDDFVFTGVNVHVRNGSGDTDGIVNGLGNLIVGYNEDTLTGGTATRTGSHNLVLGTENEYTSYGGFVGGTMNTISGAFSSISGGFENTASGYSSSVSGGYYNTASGTYSSVSGGYYNTASGTYSSVSGGYDNTASGDSSSVSGGAYNTASGALSSVSGGNDNTASGFYSSVSGGYQRSVSGTDDWRAGTLFEDE